MSQNTSNYEIWYAALKGQRLPWPKDAPPAGYWRQGTSKGQELIAIWYEGGVCKAWRSLFGNGQKLEGGASIGEELSKCFSFPVPYAIWQDAKTGKTPLPPEFLTRLTGKEIEAGVICTQELGLTKLNQGPEQEDGAENPRAIIGGNAPPVDLTPDQVLAARVRKVAANFQDFLAKIGGKIKTKAEADVAANYATKFGEFKSLAEVQHKVEKEPFLSKGREVDARWLPTARDAESHRAAVLKYAKVWTDAEQAAREEEARKANEIARQAALKEAQITGEPVEAIAEVKAEKVSIGTAKAITGRAKTIWQVTDSEAYFFYLRKTCPEAFKDVIAAMQKLANAQKSAKVEPRPPGLTEKEQETLR